MAIDRVTIELSGGPGGLGITTFWFLDGAAAQPAVRAFADSWQEALPNDITLTVQDQGDRINEETGGLVGTWSGGVVAGYVGIGTGAWAAGVGIRIRWLTAGIVNGRRVSGTTFLVPIMFDGFRDNGVPTVAVLDAYTDAADALIAATPGNMVVWSRPKIDPETDEVVRVGSKHAVTSAVVPVIPTSLRTRRR